MKKLSHDSHTNTRIYTGPKTCNICNAEINKPYSVRKCLNCNTILCKKCSEYGLCPDHFQELTEQDKEFLKKKYRSPHFYTWFSTILVLVLMGPYVYFKLDLHTSTDLWVIILLASIEIALLGAYMAIIILQIRYGRKIKPSLHEIIKNYKDMNRAPGFVKITNTDAALEKILNFYRIDERIQTYFGDKDLLIQVKFLDTKRTYSVKIQQGHDISLDPNPSIEKTDIGIKIRTEQVLFDVMNKDVTFADVILARNMTIGRGRFKFLRLARKAPYKLGQIIES